MEYSGPAIVQYILTKNTTSTLFIIFPVRPIRNVELRRRKKERNKPQFQDYSPVSASASVAWDHANTSSRR